MRMKFLKNLRTLIPYVFFGVCTTVVNIVCYWFCAYVLNEPIPASTIVAWIIAVLFAYVTNRKWVFSSQTRGVEAYQEIVSFILCRLGTGLLDLGIMYFSVDVIYINDVLIKTISNIITILLNYIASKFMIFKNE